MLLAGASGTIGRAVATALSSDGHRVTCLSRADFADAATLAKAVAEARPETVISCIASRSGSPKDTQTVDYQANANLLAAAQAADARHFILLSAICVQKPRLAFQHAKLAFEAELQDSGIDWTIVRPTAFFKSLSGQIARVRDGKPFLLFGNGELTRCKPISDADLARFIADCVTRTGRRNCVLPIGGPGPAISPREQGAMMFELAGREPRFRSISPSLFKLASHLLSLGAPFFDWFAAKAEYARIAHYYATESMLVLDPETGAYSEEATPEFGSDTLRDHYRRLIEKGVRDT
ncbi:NAD(P)H-binding protein [Erythrobacter sp. JK5]|uniref:NAD(P)H-binding protein n=1 Tax=Erythrobacter sp. JK5 TaxID=2829500 RepID=UPI0021128C30|nr:NAD(P)H-binding protein [Erythrobacter sp. JK5]